MAPPGDRSRISRSPVKNETCVVLINTQLTKLCGTVVRNLVTFFWLWFLWTEFKLEEGHSGYFCGGRTISKHSKNSLFSESSIKKGVKQICSKMSILGNDDRKNKPNYRVYTRWRGRRFSGFDQDLQNWDEFWLDTLSLSFFVLSPFGFFENLNWNIIQIARYKVQIINVFFLKICSPKVQVFLSNFAKYCNCIWTDSALTF